MILMAKNCEFIVSSLLEKIFGFFNYTNSNSVITYYFDFGKIHGKRYLVEKMCLINTYLLSHKYAAKLINELHTVE